MLDTPKVYLAKVRFSRDRSLIGNLSQPPTVRRDYSTLEHVACVVPAGARSINTANAEGTDNSAGGENRVAALTLTRAIRKTPARLMGTIVARDAAGGSTPRAAERFHPPRGSLLSNRRVKHLSKRQRYNAGTSAIQSFNAERLRPLFRYVLIITLLTDF